MRYKLTLEYDGTPYAGWQRQNDAPSVQQAVEEAVQGFCGEAVEVVGGGRTDAGVHARGQVAHIDLPKEYDIDRVVQGINFHLAPHHPGIAVLDAEPVADEFHARFSATRRFYVYRLINRRPRLALDRHQAWHVPQPLDVIAMQEAAKHLLGHHDFTSFRDSECQAKSPTKTLDGLEVVPTGEQILFVTHARSFLHHQVRIMVGSLVHVGLGKWQPDDMKTALEAKDRTKAGPTAPAHGLTLVGIGYDN